MNYDQRRFRDRGKAARKRLDFLMAERAKEDPTQFYFKGDFETLQKMLDQPMTEQDLDQITYVYINVTGVRANQPNELLYIFTIMLGLCLIFPLFAMCCNSWKKAVYSHYELPVRVYKKLQVLFESKNVNDIHMVVYDNYFSLEKGQLLYDMLYRSPTKGFAFENQAEQMDVDEREFSNFASNTKPILSLPIRAMIKWGDFVLR